MSDIAARHGLPGPAAVRRDLLGRTALCGALMSLALATPALALPVLGSAPPQVNTGGGAPVITGGPGETDVALHAPRTVIDWATYNVAGGEKVAYTFDSRNWIVLNKIDDNQVPTVSGTITGTVGGAFGGNIWFAAKSGMIFGAGAQVDAGGILVSAAAPDLTSFLNPNNTTFSFPGSEIQDVPVVGMASGAQVTGHGGLVAFIAPEVVTQSGTSVTGLNGSSVLFGAANGYVLRLAQNAPGDFDLVDFVITNPSQSSVLLDLQNATSANSVFVAAVSSSAASSAVINLEGMVTATAATTDGGDIVLSGGGNITGRQVGPNAGGTPTDIYLTTASANRDLLVQTSGQVFGQPYNRPPPPPPISPPNNVSLPPLSPPDCGDFCDSGNGSNGFGNGSNGFGNGNGCPTCSAEVLGAGPFSGLRNAGLNLRGAGTGVGTANNGPETLTITRADATDPNQVSALSAGRDIILTGSQMIALGSATAGRDVTIDGAALQANSLTVGRTASLKTEGGDLSAGSLILSGAGTIASAGNVEVDGASLSGGAAATLTVNARGDLIFGNGSGSASGGTITLSAGSAVKVDLASATIDSVTAGGMADVQAGTKTLNRVSGAQVLVGGGAVTVGQATSAGDIYVAGTGNVALGSGTAGDDIYVLSSAGTASLTSATLTGKGADTVGFSFAGNPDTPGNGQVVWVQSVGGTAMLGLGTGGVTGATSVNVTGGLDALVQIPTALPGALTVTAGRDVTLSAPTVSFNAVTAGRDVTLMTTQGDFTSNSPLVATRNLTIGAAGALKVSDITAGAGSITLTGTNVTAGTLMAGQDLTVTGTGTVTTGALTAGEDIALKGASLNPGALSAGRSLTLDSTGVLTTGNLTASSGSITLAGTDITAGDLKAGMDLTLTGTGVVSTGNLTAGQDLALSGASLKPGALSAGRNLSLATSGALVVGDVTSAQDLTLSGASLSTGVLKAAEDINLTATSGGAQVAGLNAGRDLNVQASGLSLGAQGGSVGRNLSVATGGGFTETGSLAVGGDANVDVGGLASLQTVNATGNVDIVANDLNIGGALSGANVQIESAGGPLQLGGSSASGAPASGMWLDNAEFSRIKVTGVVSLYAGQASGGQRGDLTVLQLDINPASTPTVDLLVGTGHNALVEGVIAPTASGGALQIGNASNTSWQPTQILVSGTIGSATFNNGDYSNVRAFNHVKLVASQDIIMGSQRFIGLVQQTPLSGIEIGKNQPTGVAATGAEQNVVLVAAGDLELSAKHEVVTQNTAPTPDKSVGLFINGKSNPNLIIDPPQLIDVYGAFVSPAGEVVSSFSAGSGVSVAIVDASGAATSAPPGAVYRFNSCSVGTNQCSAAVAVTDTVQQQMPVLASNADSTPGGDVLGADITGAAISDDDGSAASSARASSQRAASQRAVPPPLLASSPADPDAALAEPVTTGAGSEEIWRSRQVTKDAKPEAKR